MRRVLAFATLACLAPCAWADAYKCLGDSGRVSYSFVPCPVAKGDTEWAKKVQQAQWASINPEEAKPDAINKRATKILQASYRTKVRYTVEYHPEIIVPREKKALPKAKPMRCSKEGGQTRCDGLARP